MRSARLACRSIWRDRRGVAALEFSVIALFMVTLMLAAYDLGNAAQEQIQLQQAVRAGGQYAMSFPTDTAGIQSAVTNALPNGWNLSSAPAIACYCLNPGTGGTSALGSCSATSLQTCTGANIGKMVSITATMPYTSLTVLFANAIPNNTATYVARFQ